MSALGCRSQSHPVRVGVHIREQSSSGEVFLLLRNEGKVVLTEELKKEAARIGRAERVLVTLYTFLIKSGPSVCWDEALWC